MSQPEVQRQVRQQRTDVDALEVEVDRGFEQVSGQLEEVLRLLKWRR